MTKDLIQIDGSQGEGGGQILRTALALSLVTGQPFRISKIRAGRKNPGLLRQHLTAVKAAQAIGQAQVDGAHLGATQLTFTPGQITAGDYHFAIGTAGSATLVLQTVLPALLLQRDGYETATRLTLEGGTHNPFAPPFGFLTRAFLPLLKRMGAEVNAQLLRHGFYPAGGGQFTVEVEPVAQLAALSLHERGDIRTKAARALVASLPRNVAERELKVVREKLNWNAEWLHVEEVRNSPGPGNVVSLEIESAHLTEVFTGFGERGVPAEAVANKVIQEARRYLAAEVPVGEYLADQLLLPLALAGGGSFVTLPPSRHTTTNIEVIQQFLPLRITTHQLNNRAWQIEIAGR
jgi:RNA 3'-terminal phosphate cyclase (ATP)